MSYYPPVNDISLYPSMMISPYSREGNVNAWVGGAPASGAWPSTNRAFYNRIYIPAPCIAYKFFWLNGATASTNNIQIGLYYDDGTNQPGSSLILGTSTLASGANACQYDNITDTWIGPGIYWLAIWGNGTTTTVYRRLGGASTPFPASYMQSSLTTGLPSSATPISAGGSAAFHVYGIVTRSTP